MITLLNNEIAPSTLGIVYVCEYVKSPASIKVVRELQFSDPFSALQAYANIHNPESQLAAGKTREDLVKELTELHSNMTDKLWLESLADFL